MPDRTGLMKSTNWVAAVVFLGAALAHGQGKKPNILVIFGDDIGYWKFGAYTHGMMGRTPNTDSIAKQGILFTDHYGQPSCTAGRAAFIMGQLPVRSSRPYMRARFYPKSQQFQQELKERSVTNENEFWCISSPNTFSS